MSQTSIERLRDYLAQLPPQSQALLMREFERAIERGEDTRRRHLRARAIAQDRARGRGRGRGAAAHRRSGAAVVSSARAVSRRRQFSGTAGTDPPRLAAAGLAMAQPRRRARAGARIRGGTGQGARRRRDGRLSKPPARKFQLAAAEAIVKIATPVPGDDKQRALARVGPPNVVEDLLVDRLRCCRRARRWIRWAAGFPAIAGASAIPRSPR